MIIWWFLSIFNRELINFGWGYKILIIIVSTRVQKGGSVNENLDSPPKPKFCQNYTLHHVNKIFHLI